MEREARNLAYVGLLGCFLLMFFLFAWIGPQSSAPLDILWLEVFFLFVVGTISYRLLDGHRYKPATLALEEDRLVLQTPPARFFFHTPGRLEAPLSGIKYTKLDERRALFHAKTVTRLGVKVYADFEMLFREPGEMESLVRRIRARTAA